MSNKAVAFVKPMIWGAKTVCHNCSWWWTPSYLNPSTGICPTCAEVNLPFFGIRENFLQRCIKCRIYRNDVWNNYCAACRYGDRFLCERVGYFYCCKKKHENFCWCFQQTVKERTVCDCRNPISY